MAKLRAKKLTEEKAETLDTKAKVAETVDTEATSSVSESIASGEESDAKVRSKRKRK